MLNPVQQNSTNHPLPIRLVSSTDHVTAVTGATVAVTISKDGGLSWVSASGAVSETGNGLYWLAGNATDRNTLGRCIYRATATGADDYMGEFTVFAYDPWNVLPSANAGSNNGLVTGSVPGGAFGSSQLVNANVMQYGSSSTAAPVDGSGRPYVQVQTYATGQDPGTYVLLTPANKLSVSAANKAAATIATGDGADAATLLTRLTAARAGYLDNLNVGGPVASHADVVAINQSASKHLLLVTVGQYEPGETYTVECRTFAAADGSAVNADTTPTLTATGNVSGSLSANLSAATNPATGVYRWTYTPGATPTLEQIRFDVSATISSSTFTLSAYSQTVDEASVVWTATDQSHLTSIFNKLPAGNLGDATAATQTSILNDIIALGTPLQDVDYTVPPTVAQIATKIFTDLTNSSDFSTAGSFGALVKANLDANIGSRAAPGAQMDLVSAPNVTAIAAIQNGLAKTATFVGMTSLANWLRALARKDSPDATALSEINSVTNGIAGTWDSTVNGIQTIPTAAAIATTVRDVNNANPAANSIGAKINSAASAGDPWATNEPGAYAQGTFGYLVSHQSGGSANFAITPLQASTTNPRFTTRDLPAIAQGSTPTDVWVITDGSGNPVNLAGKTVGLVAYTVTWPQGSPEGTPPTLTPVFNLDTNNNITIGGTSNNNVSVTYTAAATATPGCYRYELWNITDKLPLAKGRLPIEAAVMAT